jgi:beta-galactosidase
MPSHILPHWLAASFRCLACLGLPAVALLLLPALGMASSPRERISLNQGWRFALGHATDRQKDFNHATGFFSYLAKTGYGDGPASAAFDDRGWRLIDVPHDWGVEMPFDARGSHSHGYKAFGPGFPETSVGWYRRSFHIPAEDLGRRIRIEFDGVYRAARVFVNGFFVGEEPSGYLDASYDITDYLNYGGDNVVAVRVDASMEEGWFYEGAGIYRHVWLSKTSPVHVVRHGTWVRTEVGDEQAKVLVETELKNEGREPADITLKLTVLAPDGSTAAEQRETVGELPAGAANKRNLAIQVRQPKLWSLESPHLYTLITEVESGGKLVDRAHTAFGIRTIRFDPDRGFFLNGKHVVLKGTNNHQDHAGVGAAIPDALQEFRIRRLKEMGSNAYRASHNPPTPELLDVCDRLGMLVIDETRLMGINEYHLTQLERLIRRDRNHPSVILWSLGNEEWAIEGNIKGARITTTMQDFAKRLDPTRMTTVAISGGWGGISTVVDVMGVNYIKHGSTDKQHAEFPKQIIIGTEETTTQGTRGVYVDDRARCHLAPVEDGSSGGNAELGWKHYAARPYAAGVFWWTGFDYRGEPTPFGWPAISSQFGIVDTCGFPKDSFYYLKSWWTDEPVLYVFPHWNWAGREGQNIEVRAHSNCEEVELFVNGQSAGRKKMEPNGHLSWQVQYAPGALLARGYRGGKEILQTKVETTGAPAALELVPDRSELKADRQDVSVITVEARDAQGRLVPTAAVPVTFSLRGPGKIIGVGNGDPSSHEPDQFVESVSTIPIGKWKAPDAAPSSEGIVFEAQFDLPSGSPVVELMINALGPKQTLWLNGEAVYQNQPPSVSRATLKIPSEKLRPTGNTLRIESNRFENWSDRESLNQFHPASIRQVTPAAPWKRTTFNGLAQVIVQSTGEPGEIVLSAEGPGVTTAELRVRTTRK